jgi:hypothetical protein
VQDKQQDLKVQQKVRASNLRTGLILGSIAVAFFVGIFVKRMWFS